MDAPNLVLVVLDTARADLVGAAPVFSDLASRGRRFQRAVAPAPWTLPSHVSLFSGLRPSEHGVTGAAVLTDRGPRTPRPRVEALADRWLPELLRRKGYATFAASANPWVGEATGLTFGFEEVAETWRAASLPKLADPLKTNGSSMNRLARKARAAGFYSRRLLGLGDGGASAALRAFRLFLSDRADKRQPFFAFFNVMEPHAPYAPPRPHHRVSKPLAALKTVRRWNADRMLRYCLGREEILEDELALLRELYAGEIAYSDAWLGRLLNDLDEAGLLDDTVVVVTADHGENLGEGHLLSHVMSMRQTLLHVPLAMAGPGVEHGVEHAPTGLTALPSTLLGLAEGRWLDPASQPAVAEYESAAAQVTGAKRLEEWVDDLSDEARGSLRASWVAAYEGRFKLLASSAGEEQLIDLEADPAEERDVRAEHPDVAERLRARRGSWAGEAAREPGAETLDAEIAAHLEGLGYL